MIYDGFKTAVAAGVPKGKAGILVDEQFGAAILRDAATRGYVTACPAEKSGQEEFDFEFSSLGPHQYDRRRIIVARVELSVAMRFGRTLMPIPFLAFADESIEDDDKTLRPIFDQIMRDAAGV